MKEVYLAGPITGLTYSAATGWRDDPLLHHYLKVNGWHARSPMRGKEHLDLEGPLSSRFDAEMDAVTRDISDIKQVDAILMNLAGAKHVSIGTMCELGFAYGNGTPVITVREYADEIHNHLFIEELSSVIVPTLADAIEELRLLGRLLREPAYA